MCIRDRIPDIRFVACPSGAMDTGLLASAYADYLSTLGVANRVGLGVFEGNQRNHQVDFGLFRQIFILGHHVPEHFAVDFQIIAALLKGHTVRCV